MATLPRCDKDESGSGQQVDLTLIERHVGNKFTLFSLSKWASSAVYLS